MWQTRISVETSTSSLLPPIIPTICSSKLYCLEMLLLILSAKHIIISLHFPVSGFRHPTQLLDSWIIPSILWPEVPAAPLHCHFPATALLSLLNISFVQQLSFLPSVYSKFTFTHRSALSISMYVYIVYSQTWANNVTLKLSIIHFINNPTWSLDRHDHALGPPFD